MGINTGQATVGTTAVAVVSMPPGPCAATFINNNTAGAIAIGGSTAVSMANTSATVGNFAGALIPAGQQVTITLLKGAPGAAVYAVGATAGTLSTILVTDR